MRHRSGENPKQSGSSRRKTTWAPLAATWKEPGCPSRYWHRWGCGASPGVALRSARRSIARSATGVPLFLACGECHSAACEVLMVDLWRSVLFDLSWRVASGPSFVAFGTDSDERLQFANLWILFVTPLRKATASERAGQRYFLLPRFHRFGRNSSELYPRPR